MIRMATVADAERICEIYNPYVLNTAVTFEAIEVSVAEMRKRIETRLERHAWYVYEDRDSGQVEAYAYAGIWRERQAYRFTAEVTVYVCDKCQGKGIGKALYTRLIDSMREKGYQVLVAGIALPNQNSIKVHEAMGFKRAATFKNVGYKFDRWMDIGFWELQLNDLS